MPEYLPVPPEIMAVIDDLRRMDEEMEAEEEQAALQRAWDALQATPSYCEENARQFAQGGTIHHEQH